MLNRALLRTLFTAGIDEEDLYLYIRVLFINGILYVLSLILVLFSIMHSIRGHSQVLINAELGALALIVFLFTLLHLKKSIILVGHVAAIGVMAFFMYYIPATENESLSFVWVFFAPLFIVLMNGWKVGLVYIAILFVYLFPIAYENIGIWESGNWSQVSFYRFVAGLMLSTFFAIALDLAIYFSNLREQCIRATEGMYVRKLEELSNTDGLTGIYNRRCFNDVFASRAKALTGGENSLLFFIVDIDYFKAYNDEFGHQAGDEVIKKVAEAIRSYMRRESDYVFRLGGEEFGGLLETRDPHKTAEWLSHIKEAVEAMKIPHASTVDMPYISISGGMSSTNVYSSKTVKELYKRADDALYQAKNQGRNQFVVDLSSHYKVS